MSKVVKEFRKCYSCGNTLPQDYDDDLCRKCSEPSMEERVRVLEELVDQMRALLNI